MKKFLTILWIIILGGTVFIAINKFKPKSEQPEKIEKIAEVTEATDAKIPRDQTPKTTDDYIKLAKNELNAREIEKAKNIIWTLDQNNSEVKYYKAIILILYKELDEAKKLFEEIAKNDKETNAELIENTKKFLEAYTTFSYYKESDKVFLELLLAKTLIDVKEYQTAIPLLFSILNTKNNYRDAWIVLGYSYLNINKPNDAIDALLQAKALTSEKPETLFFLGLAYFAKNDIDKAIYYVEQADKYGYEPKDQVNLKLGDLYLLKENDKKAKEYYKEAYKTGGGNQLSNMAAIRYNKLTEKELQNYQINVSAPNSQ